MDAYRMEGFDGAMASDVYPTLTLGRVVEVPCETFVICDRFPPTATYTESFMDITSVPLLPTARSSPEPSFRFTQLPPSSR